MNLKKARKLRKAAKEATQEGAPYEEFKTTNVIQRVPPNWAEHIASQAKDYEGPIVAPLFAPYLTSTFVLVEGCTRYIYKQLKKVA